MATATYLIPECNLAELTARIEKLNRRARKLAVPEITFTAEPDHVRYRVRQLTVNGETNLCWRKSLDKTPAENLPAGAFLANAFEPTGEAMTWFSVAVTGSTPSFNGWHFVAVLEPLVTDDGEVVNLIQCAPGETCPESFRKDVGRCDHCHAARRRKQTFVVKHETDGCKVVGRQCLKDFLGYNGDPHDLAAAAEMIAELGDLCESAGDDEWLGGGSSRERHWDLKYFLALTACRVRLFGWKSRGKARDEMRNDATADMVIELLTPPGRLAGDAARRDWEQFVAKHVKTEADDAQAESAIEWAKHLPAADLDAENNYLANCNLVARVGTVGRKTVGIGASIIVAHAKALEREVKRAEEAARPTSNHIGTVGERIKVLKVTCERVIMKENAYGVTGIHKLTAEDGSDLVWFASKGRVLADGETLHVSATVKGHGEYNGRKQTTLTNVTPWDEEPLAEYLAKEARKAARLAKKKIAVAA
jgi:hypothetical protein